MWNMERAAQQEKRFLDENIRAHKNNYTQKKTISKNKENVRKKQ